MSAILAWTWIPADRRLPHGDGRPIVEGETLSVVLPLMLCEHGLHASESVLDALQYATSGLVARVECSGEIARGKNKLCCEHRKALWVFDATRVLHLFACDVAEQALRKTGVTEARCWNAIRAKRAWVVGVATDEELDAAWDAARDVARNATSAAAWDAAWAAANAAANAVAWDAAWEAAWAAASAAAWDAARDAARAAAWAAASAAAWAAASAAAWAAASAEQSALLETMLSAAHEKQVQP